MPIKCPHPPPPGELPSLSLRLIEPGTRFFRVGLSAYPVDAWDARADTNYRFSPLVDHAGSLVPVSYAGATPEVALLESILRFTPKGGGGHVARKHYLGKCLAEVKTTRQLQLIPLCGPEAQALEENKAVAISHAFAADYPITRQWAARFFLEFPKADGIEWISHQENRNTAILLWQRSKGERIAPYSITGDPYAIESEEVFPRLCELANLTGHTLDLP